MKKEKFEKALKKANSTCRSDCDVLLERSVRLAPLLEIQKGQRNLIIVIEELSELSKAITKALRGKLDKTNLIEEIADVTIGLKYLSEIFGIKDEEVSKAINVKLDQLEENMNHLNVK